MKKACSDAGLFYLEFQQSALWRRHLNFHPDDIFGEQFLYLLGPFYKTQVATVEIFVKSYVLSFAEAVDSIEIEVIDRFATGCPVLVDNGESRAADNVFNAQHVTQSSDECGLAGSEVAVECHHSFITKISQELFGRFVNLF